MSFDAQIAELNTNLKALIAAIAAAGSVTAASTGTAADAGTTTTTTAGKGKGKAGASKPAGPSREEMVAALTEVKEKFGAAEAKAIITKVGASKMAEIADDKIEAAFKLAKSKIEADAADTGGDDDDGL